MSFFQPLKKTVTMKTQTQTITWGAADCFNLFAGPDIVEDEGLVLEVAQELKKMTTELGIPWVLKCSYDKANRQSAGRYRGPGTDKALQILERVKSKVNCSLLTDVHETEQVSYVSEVADVIQIPAFLCRQTDLIIAAAQTGKVLHVKKGQFMAPWDMEAITQKAIQAGNDKILLCERGTCFGYNRLINDMTGLIDMRALGFPVIMDITHSTQLPGATGQSSGGRREMAPALARAALAVGVDGIFLETHPNPDQALCDGPTSIKLSEIPALLNNLLRIWKTHSQGT